MKKSTHSIQTQDRDNCILRIFIICILATCCAFTCVAQTPANAQPQRPTNETATAPRNSVEPPLNVSKRTKSIDNESLKTSMKENVKRVKILNKGARGAERNGKYYRRTRAGRLRTFTYDFLLGKFVCDPDSANPLYYDPTNCNPPYEIHEMDAVRIKIININPFIYTVNLFELQGDRISNENLTEGNSSRSLTINFPTLAALSVEKVGLASTTEANLMAQIQEAEKLQREIDLLKTSRLEQELLVTNDSMGPSKQDQMQLLTTLAESIKKKDDELFSLNQKINAKNLSSDKIKGKEMELQTCLTELQNNAFAINGFVSAYNSFVYLVHSPTNRVETIRDYMDATFISDGPTMMRDYAKSASQVLRKIGEANLKIQELIELDAALVKDKATQTNKDYDTRAAIYNVIQQKLDVFEKDFRALDGNKLMGQILFLRTMVDPAHFTIVYQTHSIAENADYVKYNFEFKPTVVNNALALAPSRANLDLAFQIHEGAKFDISSGFVLDFALTDPSYYFDKTTDLSGGKVYVRKGGDSGNVNPSIAVFLNGYKRTSTNFKLGGALGVGLSNNARFRLYAGPTLIIGRKERIVLSGGVSFGAISRLADGYTEGMELDNNTSLPNEVPTVLDHYKAGGYIGVGFNLTGKENKSFMEKLKFN